MPFYSMDTALLIFPHQLFDLKKVDLKAGTAFLVEEYLFFRQYNFHKQKIVFHRAGMKNYAAYLKDNGFDVHYIESNDNKSDIRNLITYLAGKKIKTLIYTDVTDNWLQQRIVETASAHHIALTELPTPLFLTSKEENNIFFGKKEKYFQTDYYTWQRKRLGILVDEDQKPFGGKWTYDTENRLKYPKSKKLPAVHFPVVNEYYKEAITYTQTYFANNNGNINEAFIYPSNFEEAAKWLDDFLTTRFAGFGHYEDALVADESVLHHSVISPLLNVGLLTPKQVIDAAIHSAEKNRVPLNDLEGFIRQIIGWREFIRAVYEREGTKQRTTNYWKFRKKMPRAFYDGTTGIIPVDQTIRKLNHTAYCHHIERLMVLGNFMLLCEIHPDEVYQWFMELFIDAYDWVMVPNIYGMTQFADGGLMCTKPYISGSNYIFKMSDYAKSKKTTGASWENSWDGLFWRFMTVQKNFFSQNPRLGMLLTMFDKMPPEKQQQHLDNAEGFLKRLSAP